MMNYTRFYHYYDSLFQFFPLFSQISQNRSQKYPYFDRKKMTPNFFSLTECQRIILNKRINFSKQIPQMTSWPLQ